MGSKQLKKHLGLNNLVTIWKIICFLSWRRKRFASVLNSESDLRMRVHSSQTHAAAAVTSCCTQRTATTATPAAEMQHHQRTCSVIPKPWTTLNQESAVFVKGGVSQCFLKNGNCPIARVLWGASEHTLGTVAPRALNFIHSSTNSSAYKYIIQNTNRDFFGGPVVKKSPCNARGQGFDPWSGN